MNKKKLPKYFWRFKIEKPFGIHGLHESSAVRKGLNTLALLGSQ